MTSRLMEEFLREERNAGEMERAAEIAKRLVADNALPLDEIAKITALPLDEVKQLAEQNKSENSSTHYV